MLASESARNQLAQILRDEDNVVGYSGDLHDDKVRIYLREDEPKPAHREVEGHKVEFMTVGEQQKNSATLAPAMQKQKVRPLQGGPSVGPKDGGTGTLGFFAVDGGGKIGLITSSHVLPTEGKEVWQPSPGDGGKAEDACATVTTSKDDGKLVDAAFATLAKQDGYEKKILGIGDVTGSRAAKLETVKKSGRTTDVTSGTIVDLNATTVIGSDTYEHQILITSSDAFALGGDSGSVIVADSDKKVVGLEMSANVPYGTRVFANHIGDVEKKLGITIV